MVDWNSRFQQQADWTRSLREFIYPQIGVPSASRILEIGCGTGVICRDLQLHSRAFLAGVDIDLPRLFQAHQLDRSSAYLAGDAFHLPFSDNSFDICLCHYLLLWLNSPLQALSEFARVTRKGGCIAALSEPDYDSRIDSPSEMEKIGKLQTQSLFQQGIDPRIGRKLPELFSSLGLEQIQFGASGFQTQVGAVPDGLDMEWEVIVEDLKDSFSETEISNLRAREFEFWKSGSRVLWVPTFYIFGTKV